MKDIHTFKAEYNPMCILTNIPLYADNKICRKTICVLYQDINMRIISDSIDRLIDVVCPTINGLANLL